MADDIDDLLDEVEDKYLKKNRTIKTPPSKREISRPTKRTPAYTKDDDDDLNAAIDDIIGDTEVNDPTLCNSRCNNKPTSKETTTSSSFKKSSQKRCFPVYIGGSAIVTGVSSAMMERACDQLRCTSCDFKVVFYDNVQWDSSCDYIFFRNNVPDYQRLCCKLKNKKGSRAYACQCTWRSVTNIVDLASEDIKWVCGKHAS